MGVIRSVDQGPRPCVLYLTPNGTAVAATPALVSLLSLPPSVLPGPAETLFSDHTHLSSLLVGPNITLTSATVLPTPQQVILRTNFGEDIPGTATVSVWGSDDQPILAMSFVSPGQDRLSVGVGASGEIVHCSPALETRLGRNAAALAGRNALEVIAEPVRTFLRGLSMSTSVVVGLDGRTVPLDKRGSIETWVRVTARQVEGAGTGEASVLLTLTPLDGGASPTRM